MEWRGVKYEIISFKTCFVDDSSGTPHLDFTGRHFREEFVDWVIFRTSVLFSDEDSPVNAVREKWTNYEHLVGTKELVFYILL